MADTANIQTLAQAAGVAVAIGALTGQQPSSRLKPNGEIVLYWTPQQLPAVRAWLDSKIKAPITLPGLPGKPGAPGAATAPGVTIDYLPVVLPKVLAYGLPAVLLVFLAGYMYRASKSGRRYR